MSDATNPFGYTRLEIDDELEAAGDEHRDRQEVEG